jgi:hypothetical protein
MFGEAKQLRLVAMVNVVFQAKIQRFPKANTLLSVMVVVGFTLDTK